LQCPAIKGYKSISFKCAVAKIHIESTRKTLPESARKALPEKLVR
jgi:hypothetical protein